VTTARGLKEGVNLNPKLKFKRIIAIELCLPVLCVTNTTNAVLGRT
jgi:hypothetical protein